MLWRLAVTTLALTALAAITVSATSGADRREIGAVRGTVRVAGQGVPGATVTLLRAGHVP